MSFLKTKGFKYLKNLIIGIGAAVVLLGALFKLESWPGASTMLTIGLGTEAFIFLFLGLIGPNLIIIGTNSILAWPIIILALPPSPLENKNLANL